MIEGLAARQCRPQRQFAGKVADATVHVGCSPSAVDAQDLGPPTRRAQQVEQQSDRGGLARAVRSEEPEDLACFDLEIECVERGVMSEAFGEGLGSQDGRGHVLTVVTAHAA